MGQGEQQIKAFFRLCLDTLFTTVSFVPGFLARSAPFPPHSSLPPPSFSTHCPIYNTSVCKGKLRAAELAAWCQVGAAHPQHQEHQPRCVPAAPIAKTSQFSAVAVTFPLVPPVAPKAFSVPHRRGGFVVILDYALPMLPSPDGPDGSPGGVWGTVRKP